MSSKQAILFINGEVNLAFCERYITQQHQALPLYCADGAYHKIATSKPLIEKLVAIIGDGDSATSLTTDIKRKYILKEDQNFTDFEKALSYLHDQGFKEVLIFGAGGGELDHTLSNVFILLRYKSSLALRLIDEYSYSFLLNPSTSIENVKGKMISIIPLMQLNNITLTGCKYPLNDAQLAFDGQLGTRNHAVKNKVEIQYKSGDGLIVISHESYHNFDEKMHLPS